MGSIYTSSPRLGKVYRREVVFILFIYLGLPTTWVHKVPVDNVFPVPWLAAGEVPRIMQRQEAAEIMQVWR